MTKYTDAINTLIVEGEVIFPDTTNCNGFRSAARRELVAMGKTNVSVIIRNVQVNGKNCYKATTTYVSPIEVIHGN